MHFDLTTLEPRDRYKVLASLITPRPIAWVTTVDRQGVVNAAPFSFFNVFGSNPPVVAFAPGNRPDGSGPKDTAVNLRASGEFVINLVDDGTAEAMNQTAAPLPPGQSEIDFAGLTTAPSTAVRPPRIAESPVAFECREHSTIEIGATRMVVGIVLHAHVRDGILDPATFRLIGGTFSPSAA